MNKKNGSHLKNMGHIDLIFHVNILGTRVQNIKFM